MTAERTSVNHVGLTVSDLDASVAFYTDVVGMMLELPAYRTGGEWFDALTGNAGAVIDVAMLRAGSLVLQLVQYREGGEPTAVTGHARAGNVHLSVDVEDAEAKHAAVTATGRYHPTPIVDLPFPGARSFYVRDPDGIPVEFIELAHD